MIPSLPCFYSHYQGSHWVVFPESWGWNQILPCAAPMHTDLSVPHFLQASLQNLGTSLSAKGFELLLIKGEASKPLSLVQLFATPWIAACQSSLFLTISRSLRRLMSTESVMPSNHLILWHPLLLLPSIFSSIRIFSNESALFVIWPKYWSFSINPSNAHSKVDFLQDWLWYPCCPRDSQVSSSVPQF